MQPIAERTVADLIMVLQKGDEGCRRKMSAGAAAPPAAIGHLLTLKGKAFGQGPSELGNGLAVVAIIARGLPGADDVEAVMQVIIPLSRISEWPAVCAPYQPIRVVVFIFQDEMNVALGIGPATAHREFLEKILWTLVDDAVHGIEAQPVELELLEPIESILDDELTDRAAALGIIVHGRSPWRVMPFGEYRCVKREVISFRSEVVVDDVEHHHQAAKMCGIDEGLEMLGPAVGALRGEEGHAVIAPISLAGEIRNRHQFDCRDPESGKVIKLTDGGEECSL